MFIKAHAGITELSLLLLIFGTAVTSGQVKSPAASPDLELKPIRKSSHQSISGGCIWEVFCQGGGDLCLEPSH